MKETLQTILDSYLIEKQLDFADNPLGNIVRRDAPVIFREKSSLSDAYIVTGSVGQGNWAEIPWICVFDKSISVSAQQGYYIVYLFKSDMSGIYLSLNMGWTQFKQKYQSTPLANMSDR
ncbi:MrcB family domain-containing protein [Chloroflexota bacterium]